MVHALKMVYLTDEGAYLDASGELEFALKCYVGDGIPKDEDRARDALDRVHRRGRAFAAICLGFMQDNGIAIEADHDDADHWYREAALWFEKDARAGDVAAWNNLGFLKAEGWGVGRDPSAALSHFSRAGLGGCPAALYNMGVCHLKGIGVPRDPSQAMALFEQASEGDDAYAPFVLGEMYQRGQGVDEDPIKAVALFTTAAERGNVEAMSALGYAHGVGLGCERSLQRSAYWFDRAARAGNTYAQANLAMLWCQSENREEFEKGWDLLRSASRKGDMNARYQISQILLRGAPCQEPDYPAAMEVAMNLAEFEHPGGQHLLGVMYEAGWGVTASKRKAARWYRLAAEQGSANAQVALAQLYAVGEGVRQDDALAYFWFSQAAPVANTQAWDQLQQLAERISERDKVRAEQMLADGKLARELSVSMRLH